MPWKRSRRASKVKARREQESGGLACILPAATRHTAVWCASSLCEVRTHLLGRQGSGSGSPSKLIIRGGDYVVAHPAVDVNFCNMFGWPSQQSAAGSSRTVVGCKPVFRACTGSSNSPVPLPYCFLNSHHIDSPYLYHSSHVLR